MSTNINNEIMGQSRHQFIYGYNTDDRTSQMKEMVESHPIKMDESSPMGIYLESPAVETETPDSNADRMLITRMGKEYLRFTIAYTLLDRALEDNDFTTIPERVSSFLDAINRLLVNYGKAEIKSLQELLTILKMGLEYYEMNYKAAVDTGAYMGSPTELPISFLSLDVFLSYFKKMLNNNSFVAVVVDMKNPISNIATQAINEYVAKRCNSDLSMKIVCEPGSWATYYDFAYNPIEYIHDYGIVELDESHQECMKKIKGRYDI
ncbi:MAG: hypothetical protein E7167_03720 [Firmicutes bacterium]|nr:hypothetical protein [Bacillota bacterium]